MRRRSTAAPAALFAWLALLAAAPAVVWAEAGRAASGLAEGEDAPGKDASKPDCVQVRTEARYGAYGYDHIVQVENRCERAVACTITTNVNPEPTPLDVPAGESRSAITFRASPAREFTPDVTCKERA